MAQPSEKFLALQRRREERAAFQASPEGQRAKIDHDIRVIEHRNPVTQRELRDLIAGTLPDSVKQKHAATEAAIAKLREKKK